MVGYITTDLHAAFRMALSAAERHEPCSVAYHGNVVDLLEYAAQEDIRSIFCPIRLLVMPSTKEVLPRRSHI